MTQRPDYESEDVQALLNQAYSESNVEQALREYAENATLRLRKKYGKKVSVEQLSSWITDFINSGEESTEDIIQMAVGEALEQYKRQKGGRGRSPRRFK